MVDGGQNSQFTKLMPKVSIIDYGMGNIWSVASAIHYLGYTYQICARPEEILNADMLILPGVGSYRSAMNEIKKRELDNSIFEAVYTKRKKILGICLGMQLMGISGTEEGFTNGFNFIPAPVEQFITNKTTNLKIPHIGFNTVKSQSDSVLFKNLPRETDFYFVHSYRMVTKKSIQGSISTCNYGGSEFLAAYEQDNIYATQFHPEKSQTNGLKLLKNFLSI